jgi:hypothetical protein
MAATLYKYSINADIHALSWIWTHNPRVRASENISCLRPRGHCLHSLTFILVYSLSDHTLDVQLDNAFGWSTHFLLEWQFRGLMFKLVYHRKWKYVVGKNKSPTFWDITPCSPLKVWLLEGTVDRSACYLLHAGFLLALFFDPINEGDMFLRNIGLTFSEVLVHWLMTLKAEL